ncbi:MAG: MBL fold metallo-hydrolase [Clostridia bacterium]
MRICNLASGSKGNMTYVEVGSTKFLVDIGLSCKEAEKRLAMLGVNPKDIDGILISHEHGDHIRGLETFACKYGTKVFANSITWEGLAPKVPKLSIKQQNDFFDDPFSEKEMLVLPFQVSHDTKCCNGFSFIDNKRKASIATDLGIATENNLKSLSESSIIFLEANHNVDLLKSNVRYPASLKKRILGNKGHLSNEASGEVAVRAVRDGAKCIVLSHLSEENNNPKLAFDSVTNVLTKSGIGPEDVKVAYAMQDRPTSIFLLK